MTHVVTLAHRVSRLHAGYRKVHRYVFRFSWRRLWSARWGSDCGRWAEELSGLGSELAEVRARLAEGESLEPRTMLGKEFAKALDGYVVALTETVGRLQDICRRLHADSSEGQTYDQAAARQERVAYDQSVQTYKRLGLRLGQMLARL